MTWYFHYLTVFLMCVNVTLPFTGLTHLQRQPPPLSMRERTYFILLNKLIKHTVLPSECINHVMSDERSYLILPVSCFTHF